MSTRIVPSRRAIGDASRGRPGRRRAGAACRRRGGRAVSDEPCCRNRQRLDDRDRDVPEPLARDRLGRGDGMAPRSGPGRPLPTIGPGDLRPDPDGESLTTRGADPLVTAEPPFPERIRCLILFLLLGLVLEDPLLGDLDPLAELVGLAGLLKMTSISSTSPCRQRLNRLSSSRIMPCFRPVWIDESIRYVLFSRIRLEMAGRDHQHLVGGHQPLGLPRHERLGQDADDRHRELGADLVLLLLGEDVDDPVDRPLGRVGVQGAEDDVPGLGRGDRRLDRRQVSHLADQDAVRVHPQGTADRLGEVGDVDADLALVDRATCCACGSTRSGLRS